MTRTDDLRRAHATGSGRELVTVAVGSDPYEQMDKLHVAGQRKAAAVGVAYQLEHQRHVALSMIQNELAVAHATEKLSEAKLERMARADPRYAKHVAKTAKALEEREAATSDYYALKSLIEWDMAALRHADNLAKLER